MSTNSEKQYDFKPTEYDIDALRPTPDPGKYKAKIGDIKLRDKDGYAQLIVEFRLLEALEGQEQGEGLTQADFFTFYPVTEQKGDFPREKLRDLLDAAGIERSLVPKKIENKTDFDELIEALKGAAMNVWIVVKTNSNKETFVNLAYKAKGGSRGPSLPKDDDEDEAPAIRKPAAKATKTPDKGKSKRN